MNQKIIHNFRTFLNNNLYAEILINDMTMNNITWEKFLAFGPDIFKSKNRTNLMFKLLLFGEKISYKSFVEEYDNLNWLDYFIEEKIITRKNEKIFTNNLMLIYLQKKYIFVEIPLNFKSCKKKDTEVYLGIDSLLLMKNQKFDSCEKVLDLCTGSGIQLLTCSEYFSEGIGVDINDYAVSIAKLNTLLNNLENKITIVKSNLYEMIKSSYNLIFANPPFLPMDKNLNFSIVGDGGKNGFSILEQILDGFTKHLNINGHAIIIGECLGGKSNPMIVDFIKKKYGQYSYEIIINSCLPAKIVARRLAYIKCYQIDNFTKFNQYYHSLLSLYEEYGAYYYQYILRIKKHTDDEIGTSKVIYNCSQIFLDDIYGFVDEYYIDKNNGTITFKGKNISLNANLINILSLLNGKRTLEECFKTTLLYDDFDNVFLQFIPILQELINENIICKNVTF